MTLLLLRGPAEAEPTRRVVVNREHPPSKIAILVKAEDDTKLGRWAEDESSIENVLANASKTGDMPGGHGESGCALARDPKQSYPDLASFSKVEWQGVGGERLWTGTLRQQPQSDGERISIEPKAVGDRKLLEDQEEIIGPGFIDSDMSKWGDPSMERRESLPTTTRLDVAVSTGWQGTGEEPPGIIFDFSGITSALGVSDLAEVWRKADGVPLGAILYHFRRLAGGTGSAFVTKADLCTDDVLTDYVEGTNHEAVTNTNLFERVDATGDIWRYARISSNRVETVGEGELTDKHTWQLPKILGNQGLELQGQWPTVGFLARQMIPIIVEGSGLTTKDELLEDDEFIIPQAWFSDPGTRMSKLVEVTKYGLLDWFVFNDRILQYRKPATYGRRWRLSPGSGAPKNSGPDAERIFDRLMVSWQDVDGTTKTAGIPGSGAQFTDTRLQISDERNAAVAANRPKGKLLALNGVCEQEPAIKVGMRFLEEAQNLAQSGEATITGYCQDEYGIWWPAAYVQPGDWAADPGTQNYRKITNVSYAHDPKTASVSLGAPPEGLGALEARVNARLIELGLG